MFALRRIGRRWWIAAPAAVASALLLWALIPTEAARAAIIAEIAEETGHHVTLRRVAIGPTGTVRLIDLEIAERPDALPWLRVASAKLDIGLAGLLRGRARPEAVVVRGLTLDLRRDGQGVLGGPFAIRKPPKSRSADARSPGADEDELPIAVTIADSTIHWRDQANGVGLTLETVFGTASVDSAGIRCERAAARFGGGTVELAASVARQGPRGVPHFEGQARIRRVHVTTDLGPYLGYLAPVLAEAPASADLGGTLSLDVYLAGSGARGPAIARTLRGGGALVLDPVRLDGTRLLAELAALRPGSAAADVGSIRGTFAIERGAIRSDDLVVTVARVPVRLRGSTTLEGVVDYRISLAGLVGRLGPKAADWLDRLGLDQVGAVRLVGTLPVVRWQAEDGRGNVVSMEQQRERIKALGEKIGAKIGARPAPANSPPRR